MSDRDKRAMDAAMDDIIWTLLRQRADWEEEHGDVGTAAGYRWLADWRRAPKVMVCGGGRVPKGRKAGDMKFARWCLKYTSVYPPWPNRETIRPEALPHGVRPHLQYRKQYKAVSAAYHAAAVAVGRWLKEGS